jgi:hypothetical protein
MAFVFASNLTKFHLDTFRDNDCHSVHVHLGFDDITNKTYSAIVGLSPGGGALEFYFALIEVDGPGNPERFILDPRSISGVLSKEDKAKVLGISLFLAKVLIEQVKPQEFFMVTCGAPPRQALEKYNKFNQIFSGLGYDVVHGNTYRDNHLWWVTLQEMQHCPV